MTVGIFVKLSKLDPHESTYTSELKVLTLVGGFSENLAQISFKWCVKSSLEKTKCDDFVKYVKEIVRNKDIEVTPLCVNGTSTDDCVAKINNREADLITLDGGKVYDAGKTKDLIPIVSEEYEVKYYGVAVVKKSNEGFNLMSLKGKKSCHTGARRTAGWRVPIGYMLRLKWIPAVQCGNNVNLSDFLSAADFFSESCVPGVKTYNTTGEIPGKLCALCAGTGNTQCSGDTSENKYAGHHGSFKCMANDTGDVAFVKHNTVEEVVAMGGYGNASDYQYLCKDGSRKEIGQHEQCYLGFIPAHAVVTRKGNADVDNIVKILQEMSEKYGNKQTNPGKFQLFNSKNYSSSSGNLIFKDSAIALVAIAKENRTYEDFLGDDFVKNAKALNSCVPPTTTATTTTSAAIIPYAVYVPITTLMFLISF
ncbi:melanotransferrin-like [Montipora capricornis]|uniref:melanotransferrin-like n=1 Tax=Montipora capricornis TaxID=246305 RepID=UPI0035F134CF